MEITNLSAGTYSSFLEEHPLVVLLFLAEWDTHSKLLAHEVRKIDEQAASKMAFGSVDVDDEGMQPTITELDLFTSAIVIYIEGKVQRKILGYRNGPQVMEEVREAVKQFHSI